MAEPMYRVIAAKLQQEIETGKLQAGSKLKTEVELREEYGEADTPISRTTVRDAIKLLVARGLVETRPGYGTVIVGRSDPFVSKLTADPSPAAWRMRSIDQRSNNRVGFRRSPGRAWRFSPLLLRLPSCWGSRKTRTLR